MSIEPGAVNPSENTQSPGGHLIFEMEELGKKDQRWRLVIRPSDLAFFEGNDPHPYLVLREQLCQDTIFFAENVRVLVLKKPKKVTFKITPEICTAVADWMGEPVLAGFYLSRRYTWVLPVAVIWLIGSFPISANTKAGVEGKPLDIVGLGLGFALVIAWGFAKWRPHPVLFLVDSIWFICLAGYIIFDVVQGRSKLWLMLLVILLWMTLTGFKHFARFRRTRITPIKATP